MMPAISLTPLPPLPPFQFLPEADLNFDALLAGVEAVPAPAQTPQALATSQAGPVPQAASVPETPIPATTAPAVSAPDPLASVAEEHLLNFLGIDPVKAAPAEPAPAPPEAAPAEEPRAAEENRAETAPPALTDATPAPLDVPVQSQAPATPPLPPAPLILPDNQAAQGKATAAPPDHRRKPPQLLLKPELANLPARALPAGLAPEKSPVKIGTAPVQGEQEISAPTPIVKDMPAIGPALLAPDKPGEPLRPAAEPIIAAPAADPLRAIVERQLDLARDSRWLDALARDIVAVAQSPERLSFRLSPPQLGRLDVDLSTSESGLALRMNTGSEAATQIIAAAQPRLIDELKNQGVRVAEAQVSTGTGGQSHGQGQQHQQRSADQMIEYARARFDRADAIKTTRPQGRFA